MSKQIDDGGPAFPGRDFDQMCQQLMTLNPGMSVRDWFAGQALAGLTAAGGYSENGPTSMADLANDAYAYADAMIEARKEAK